jgi:hypothetical protein
MDFKKVRDKQLAHKEAIDRLVELAELLLSLYVLASGSASSAGTWRKRDSFLVKAVSPPMGR